MHVVPGEVTRCSVKNYTVEIWCDRLQGFLATAAVELCKVADPVLPAVADIHAASHIVKLKHKAWLI